MGEIRSITQAIKTSLKNKTSKNKNVKYEIEKTREVKIYYSKNTTYCKTCLMICHEDCAFKEDNKRFCIKMTND